MSNRPSSRPAALLGAGVLAVALGFAGSSVVGAEAGTPAAQPAAQPVVKPVTKAQVKKIARAVAVKQINALAPTLSVKSALTAGSATTAQSAVTAASAATAAKVGTAEVKTFGTDVATGGPAAALGTVSGLTLTGSCPGGVPTVVASAAGGKIRYQYIDNANAPFSNGTNVLATATVNSTTVNLGSGFLAYRSPTNLGVNAWYGWRLDGATCSFFGTMLGG